MDLIIMDQNFVAVDVYDTYESLIWTDRYSAYGDFEIYTPIDLSIRNKATHGRFIWSGDSEHVMIVESVETKSDVEFGKHYIISGRSLESILKRRIIWKQTVLDGYLQGQIQKLLNENIISPDDPKRKIEGFIFEETDDPYISSLKIQCQFTGDEVYDAIKKICDEVGIGFKVILQKPNRLVFKLYNGTDRSYAQNKNPYVVFSPNFENIISSDYLESTELYKNIGLVAGEGEGSSRKTVTVGDDTAAGLNRYELFVDARDISSTIDGGTLSADSYNAQLASRGNERLADYQRQKLFQGESETTQLYKYNSSFFIGDIVQLEDDFGEGSRVRVTEYIYNEDQNGSNAYPTFTVM